MKISDLSTFIRDDGELYDLVEIIGELKKYQANFDLHSMNEYALHLQGKKEMLTEIIGYLEKIARLDRGE